METVIWNSLIILSKVGFYIGFATVVGVQFHRFQIRHLKPVAELNSTMQTVYKVGFYGSFGSLILVPIWFFASTGAMAEDGINGILDPFMLELMWDSAVGDTGLWRMIGMGSIFLFLLILTKTTRAHANHSIWDLLYMGALCVLALSFTLTGHVSELGLFERGLIAAHVFVMAWWFGALLPLKASCEEFNPQQLHYLMQRFGQQAGFMVSLLFLAGGILAFKLVGSVSALLASSYGQVLLLKLTIVTTILGLAAYHKYRLVPSLLSENKEGELAKSMLSKSIAIEMGIALLILLITACLTSLVGPEEMIQLGENG